MDEASSTPEPAPAHQSSASPPAVASRDAEPTARHETRCGWFENPTPGNAWLTDRDRTWTIAMQGGAQAEGDWPGFDDEQWVATNGPHYGYGCACMSVTVDAGQGRILTIRDAQARPLSLCRADTALDEPQS
ncbi:DUF4087 domain-containing protein [Lysobacter alkalisoli]|uniref:DUF4087 domain-containing protein n=2 Tax=Marilutibacter alkalisoli TaxID=2591633 RepID=A0A514BWM4_9GAMM|nr:DUF4087 domain-containing protein [Lysobacter alkalisoli]